MARTYQQYFTGPQIMVQTAHMWRQSWLLLLTILQNFRFVT